MVRVALGLARHQSLAHVTLWPSKHFLTCLGCDCKRQFCFFVKYVDALVLVRNPVGASSRGDRVSLRKTLLRQASFRYIIQRHVQVPSVQTGVLSWDLRA